MVLCWAELVEQAEVLLLVLFVLAGEKKDTTMLGENTLTNSNIKQRENNKLNYGWQLMLYVLLLLLLLVLALYWAE